jgi:hypothetical protein
MSTTAKRLPDPKHEGLFPLGFDTTTTCYWRDRGMWWLYLPGGGVGNLSNHDVQEHEDGTITVSPSILITSTRADRRRHGFLKRGIWEPCGDDIAPGDDHA